MNQEVLARILRCPSLPTLPAVAVRVIELTSNTGVSLDELAETLQHDQALATKILRTVNSSFYGLRRPCTNINQALVMLGLSTVKSLALSFSLVSSLGSGKCEGFDFVAYWRRGLYTAIAARSVARAAGVVQEDEAFLGGLLQDIGMVAMHRALGEQYVRILQRAGADHRGLAALELDALEIQHPEASALLAERWKLPIELVVSVRYHELPTAAPAEHADLVRCVWLGSLAHDVLTDPEPGAALHKFRARCSEWFDLELAIADDQIRKISEGARQLAPLFHLNTGRYADPDSIVARARAQADAITDHEIANPPAAVGSLGVLLADSEQNDPMTGTLLPLVMRSRSRTAFAQARQNGQPVAAICIQIDGFAKLVAAGGAPAGDAVLVEVASLIESVTNSRGGLAARLDPSSFTVLLPGLDGPRALQAATAFQSALAQQSRDWVIPALPVLPITVSVGVASQEAGDTGSWLDVEQLFVAAKAAADAAHARGGNRAQSFVRRAAAA